MIGFLNRRHGPSKGGDDREALRSFLKERIRLPLDISSEGPDDVEADPCSEVDIKIEEKFGTNFWTPWKEMEPDKAFLQESGEFALVVNEIKDCLRKKKKKNESNLTESEIKLKTPNAEFDLDITLDEVLDDVIKSATEVSLEAPPKDLNESSPYIHLPEEWFKNKPRNERKVEKMYEEIFNYNAKVGKLQKLEVDDFLTDMCVKMLAGKEKDQKGERLRRQPEIPSYDSSLKGLSWEPKLEDIDLGFVWEKVLAEMREIEQQVEALKKQQKLDNLELSKSIVERIVSDVLTEIDLLEALKFEEKKFLQANSRNSDAQTNSEFDDTCSLKSNEIQCVEVIRENQDSKSHYFNNSRRRVVANVRIPSFFSRKQTDEIKQTACKSLANLNGDNPTQPREDKVEGDLQTRLIEGIKKELMFSPVQSFQMKPVNVGEEEESPAQSVNSKSFLSATDSLDREVQDILKNSSGKRPKHKLVLANRLIPKVDSPGETFAKTFAPKRDLGSKPQFQLKLNGIRPIGEDFTFPFFPGRKNETQTFKRTPLMVKQSNNNAQLVGEAGRVSKQIPRTLFNLSSDSPDVLTKVGSNSSFEKFNFKTEVTPFPFASTNVKKLDSIFQKRSDESSDPSKKNFPHLKLPNSNRMSAGAGRIIPKCYNVTDPILGPENGFGENLQPNPYDGARSEIRQKPLITKRRVELDPMLPFN